MEVSKLLEIIRIKLDDPLFNSSDDLSLFKTDELLYYINNALREVVFRGRLLVKQDYTINLVSGINEYTIPSDVISFTQALDENKKEIIKIQESDLWDASNEFGNTLHGFNFRNDWRNDTNDLPYFFMQSDTNNKVVFYPIPSKTSTVSLRAYYLSDEVLETDSLPVELSDIYQWDLIYWVLHEAYEKQDADSFDPNASDKNLNKFEEIFGKKLPADQLQEIMNYPDNPGTLRSY